MNQSRPRRLCGDGDGLGVFGDGRDRSPPPPAGGASIRSTGCLGERADRLLLRNGQGLNGCRTPEAPSTTIGVSSLYSGAAFTWSLVNSSEMLSPLSATATKRSAFQSTTMLPAADAEEPAEIDHRSANRTGAIDDDVDNVPHVLIRRAPHVAAKHAVGVSCADDGDRGRRRRLFRRRRPGAGGAGGTAFCWCAAAGGLSAGGAPGSSAAPAGTAANAEKPIANDATRRLARIRSPPIEGSF